MRKAIPVIVIVIALVLGACGSPSEPHDAVLTVEDTGGVLYGAFSGFLGHGRMELLDPIAEDLWALPCPRALDHTPPGDWTLSVQRDADGRVAEILLGCWLARGLRYRRVA